MRLGDGDNMEGSEVLVWVLDIGSNRKGYIWCRRPQPRDEGCGVVVVLCCLGWFAGLGGFSMSRSMLLLMAINGH